MYIYEGATTSAIMCIGERENDRKMTVEFHLRDLRDRKLRFT